MNFDMNNPFSGLHGQINGATYIIMERQSNCDKVIKELKNLSYRDYDIEDEDLFYCVCARYGLANITREEERYIKARI